MQRDLCHQKHKILCWGRQIKPQCLTLSHQRLLQILAGANVGCFNLFEQKTGIVRIDLPILASDRLCQWIKFTAQTRKSQRYEFHSTWFQSMSHHHRIIKVTVSAVLWHSCQGVAYQTAMYSPELAVLTHPRLPGNVTQLRRIDPSLQMPGYNWSGIL